MKRKVLIVGSSKLPIPSVKGGAVPTLIETLIHQQEKDNKIDLYCISYYDEKAAEIAESYSSTEFIWAKEPKIITFLDRMICWAAKNILRISRLHSLSFLFRVIWFSVFVGKVLHKYDFDDVIFENSLPVITAIKYFGNKKKYAGKYYLHMHSVPRKYYGNEKIVNGCKKIICISEYVANAMCKDPRLSTTNEKYTVMYNCINDKVFRPLDEEKKLNLKKELGISCEKKIVLFAGRLCADKGVEEVIDAVAQLNELDCVLLVVGSNFYKTAIVSPYERKLQKKCKSIQERVIFTGYIDNIDMPKYYNIADVVVLPSIWEEPAGMTMIEAMDCGRPLITTISGGIPEYVGADNCVLLLRNSELISNIRESIISIIRDDEFSKTLSQKARVRAEKFNEKYYYDQLLEIIGER